ncbi:pilus assembly PilX family protein [Massilia cavernae]|uniref:Agglutinin biogenesis protein MshP n=1 Tax=Massilia cavernae TaxID=2320864 RepID=A0A418Y7G7_9BURK|nr:agglutinin biogenesis protein MshP [Massilia cavernae]RJG25824.1 agglutinin biogenesis protein MshP [Massilia cavernae]
MTRKHPIPFPAMRRSRGVGLVTAIFLLVVITALCVAMVTIYTSQQVSSTLDVQGARAYQAARAGIEWGLFKRLRQGAPCGNTTTFAMDAGSSLNGFTVTVTCTEVGGPKNADGDETLLDRWLIRSVACNEPVNGVCLDGEGVNTPAYVQRVLEVQV